jgi:voltage-dependent calcium channel L type alpha-1D
MVTLNPWFDRIILLFITISTILLAVETPLTDPKSDLVKVLTYIDYVMTSIFTLEMVIKMIALGLACNGKDSYLRNAWNVLDFIIVTSALTSLVLSEYDLSFLKALRMLRILRPLRLISRNKGLKLSITCLINSIPNIINLLLIVVFFIFLMAILGTTLFAGKFYSCHIDDAIDYSPTFIRDTIFNKWDCLNYGGEWVNPDLNFDSTGISLLTLFTV